jgi:hypothetical protein
MSKDLEMVPLSDRETIEIIDKSNYKIGTPQPLIVTKMGPEDKCEISNCGR